MEPESAPPAAAGDDVDRLYQVAPAEFVEARNALVARLKAGGQREAAARVKALARPSATAWAVNQLCWQARDFIERLLDSGEALRAAQESGAPGALREAMRGRREALGSARDRALSLLRRAGHAATPAAEQRVSNTLLALGTYGRRLPDEIVLGRLTQDLEPPGFDALAGLSLPEPPEPPATAPPAPAAPAPARAPEPAAPDAEDPTRHAERARREAEQAALRAELPRLLDVEARRDAEHEAALRDAGEALAAEKRARLRVEALRGELERAEQAARAASAEAERATAEATRAAEALEAARGARVRLEIALDPAE